MKPDPLALISFGSRIGSPAMNGERAIEPVISLVASGRSLRRMKVSLAVAAGQVCHSMSLGVTVWPRPMSALATRTSTVCSCATGSAGAGLAIRSACEIGSDTASTDSDGQDDNACPIHTLHFPHYAATLPPP